MKRKILIVMLIFCLGLGLSACRQNDKPDFDDETVPNTNEDLVSEDDSSTSEVEPALSSQEILDIFLENSSVWYMEASDYEEYYYTILDMDGDGYPELIRSLSEGTGLYTYSNYYTIDKDGSFKELTYETSAGESEPDIILDGVSYFTDKKGNRWILCCDILRNGYAESHEFNCMLAKQGDVINTIFYSYIHNTVNDEGSDYDSTYFDANDNELSYEDYLAYNETMETEGLVDSGALSLYWFSSHDEGSLDELLLKAYEASLAE